MLVEKCRFWKHARFGPPRRACHEIALQFGGSERWSEASIGQLARDVLSASVKPARDRVLACAQGARSLAVGEAEDVHGDKREPERFGQLGDRGVDLLAGEHLFRLGIRFWVGYLDVLEAGRHGGRRLAVVRVLK